MNYRRSPFVYTQIGQLVPIQAGNTSLPECDTNTVPDLDVIQRLRVRLDPDMVATNQAIESCAGLNPQDLIRWRGFYSAYRAWADEPGGFSWDPLLGPLLGYYYQIRFKAKWDSGCSFSRELSEWKNRLRSQCNISGPTNIDRPGIFDFNDALNAIKWVAIIGGSIYAISTIRTALRK